MNDKISIRLHADDARYVVSVLATRPYGEVAPLIADIERQIVSGQTEAADEPELPL